MNANREVMLFMVPAFIKLNSHMYVGSIRQVNHAAPRQKAEAAQHQPSPEGWS